MQLVSFVYLDKKCIKQRSIPCRNLQRSQEEYDEYGNVSKSYRKDIFEKKLHIKKYLKSMAIQSGLFLSFGMYAQSSFFFMSFLISLWNIEYRQHCAYRNATTHDRKRNARMRVNALIIMPLSLWDTNSYLKNSSCPRTHDTL